MNLSYRKINLPFQYPFTISRGTKTHQPALVVELGLGSLIGYGEAPAITYYDVTVEAMIESLEAKRPFIEKYSFTDPERYWHYLHHLFPGNNFLICALDMAGWDLWGKMQRMPLYKLWNTRFTGNEPVTDYTIGIDTVGKMVAKMKEKPWPVYKIKLGTPEDIDIVTALRANTDAVLRVDANSGWTTTEALAKIPVLEQLGVEMIEQPLEKGNDAGMDELFAYSSLPLFADESCVKEQDVEKCHSNFHGINIKLTKCGGITPARRMIKKARSLNMKVMMGSMNESTIGSAAIAHFLPQLDFVDMDGPLLLSEDVAGGLEFNFGKITLTDAPGLGIALNNL